MARGFADEDESGRANDPSGFSFGGGMAEGQSSVSGNYGGMPSGGIASGSGRQDGPGGAQEEQGYTASGKMSGPGAAGYNAALDAISMGMNPFASSTQNFVANKLGAREPTDIPGMFGYDTKKGFIENVANMAIPGRNTPLGALSAVPGLTGASKTVQGIVGLANAVAGKLGIGSTTNPSAPKGIASGTSISEKYAAPDLENYTGRPDDAPMPSEPVGTAQTEAGQFMQGNYTTPTSSNMPLGTEQTAFNLEDITNFQMPSVSIPDLKPASSSLPLNDVLDAFGLPRSVDVPTPFGDVNVGFPDRNPVTPGSIDTSFRALGGPSTANQVAGLGSFFEKAKELGDSIVSIPGGYMDTETGKTYSGTYDKDAAARTFTGTRAPSGASPFTFESFIQNIGK